ncbi:MAG: hypothetical protein U0791_03555 [Gemmataceae bacterium]
MLMRRATARRVRGLRCRTATFNASLQDHFEHTIQVVVNFGIPESQHFETESVHVLQSSLVILSGARFGVRITVQLDDERGFNRNEVCNVSTQWMLTTELEPAKSSIAQFPPKLLLGWCRFASHPAGELKQSRIDSHRVFSAAPLTRSRNRYLGGFDSDLSPAEPGAR